MRRLIDADEVINLLVDMPQNILPKTLWKMVISSVVNKCPTIIPQHGEWIVGENENDGWCKCSICGYANLTCEVYPVGDVMFNFCPNCGADMRGER